MPETTAKKWTSLSDLRVRTRISKARRLMTSRRIAISNEMRTTARLGYRDLYRIEQKNLHATEQVLDHLQTLLDNKMLTSKEVYRLVVSLMASVKDKGYFGERWGFATLCAGASTERWKHYLESGRIAELVAAASFPQAFLLPLDIMMDSRMTPRIRLALLAHPIHGSEHIWIMSHDPDLEVRIAAASHPGMNDEAASLLADRFDDFEVRRALWANPNAPAWVREHLSEEFA